MASYQDDELQTLGDILPRMKPLPDPPPGASEDEQARTQQHNDALAQLQDNALVARHLAQNTITNGVPFPDSLLHFVPGRLLGPLTAARASGNSSPWTDPSLTDSPSGTADLWTSYGNSAFTGDAENNELQYVPGGRYAQLPGQFGVMSDAVPEKLQVRNVMPDSFVDMLRQQEGDPKNPGKPILNIYQDNTGHDTFGWGHKLTPADTGWAKDLPTMSDTQKQLLASTLFYRDADTMYDLANNQAKQLGITDPNFIQALTSANFQLGRNWLPGFPKTLDLMRAGDYSGAADEVARSAWNTQTPTRVQDFQKALRALPPKGKNP